MKSYGGLWDGITDFGNLCSAAWHAKKGSRRTLEIQRFFYCLEEELFSLKVELESGSYNPGKYRTFHVHDPKRRLISAAPFRDRVVHHAVCDVLEPVFDRIFTESSYACRRNKGTHRAVERAQAMLRSNRYFLKSDIRKFFDSVDHSIIKKLLKRRFIESRLNELLFRIIDNPVPGCARGKGLAIGNLTSQHFANLMLTDLDLFVLHELRPAGYIRYMDDFVLFDDSVERMHGFRYEIELFSAERLDLELKPSQTFAAESSHGLPFLGFQIFRSVLRVNGRTLRKLHRKLRERTRSWNVGEIRTVDYQRSLSSIFGHMANADSLLLRRDICSDIGIAGT